MAFAPLYTNGYETGQIYLPVGLYGSNGISVSAGGKTGSYQLGITNQNFGGNGYLYTAVPGGPTSIYIGCWVKSATTYPIIGLALSDTSYLLVACQSDGSYHLYINSTTVVDEGTVRTELGQWHNLQLYVDVANAGTVQLKVDGILDIDYSGDTQPGASNTISYAFQESNGSYFGGNGGGGAYALFDDFIFGSGGWPGDCRNKIMTPNADTATEDWTPSTGADSYALVDEIPPVTTDYLTSTVTGEQTILDMTDYDDTGWTPLWAAAWAYAKKDAAAAYQLKLINSDGVATNVGAANDLVNGSWIYVHEVLLLAPDGGAWADADLDALQIGIESVIV